MGEFHGPFGCHTLPVTVNKRHTRRPHRDYQYFWWTDRNYQSKGAISCEQYWNKFFDYFYERRSDVDLCVV